jgi:hypothetical protein
MAFALDAAGETAELSDPARPMLGPTEKRSTPATETAKKPISKISSTMKKGCLYLKSIFINILRQISSPGWAIHTQDMTTALIY